MKKFKLFSSLAVLSLGALALTSCGGTTTTKEAGAGSKDKEIVFYNTMGQNLQNVVKTAIEKFEEENPGWKVTSTQVGGYEDVYNTTVTNLTAGTQPDLAYCYADHVATYITTKKVLDLNTFIYDEEIGYSMDEILDFVPGYYNEGLATNFGGYAKYGYSADAMLTLPFSKSTELMYYNKDALDAYGLKVPTTWDEMWEVCDVLYEKYPLAVPLCYDSEANWLINMCEQNGWNYTSADEANHLTFKDDNNLAAWLDDLAAKVKAKPGYIETQTTYGAYTSGLFTKGVANNESGCVFCIGSSGGASYQSTNKFKWGVAPIPGTEKNGTVNSSVISQGPSLVMLDQGNPEKHAMTWKFVKEILDPTFQATFSMTSGYNPVRQSSFEDEDYKDWLSDDTNIVAVAASVAKTLSNSFYTSPAFRGSADARVQMSSVVVYVLQGEKTGKKALEDAYKNCGGR